MRKSEINPIDQHVGSRARRLELDISQTEVADDLGLTFQQVQKYEKGPSARAGYNTCRKSLECQLRFSSRVCPLHPKKQQ